MNATAYHLMDLSLKVILCVLLPIIPSYLLYKTLPARTTVSGPFKGLNIQLTGAFGGYFLVLLVVVGVVFLQREPAHYEVWRVSGKVTFKNGGPRERLFHPDFSVQPPTLYVYPDGRFDLDVPVRLGQDGNLEFPNIVIDHNGYIPQTISFANTGATFGGKNYNISQDCRARKWQINNHIVLEPLPGGGVQ